MERLLPGRGVRGGEDLDVLGIAHLLAGVDVDQDRHCVSLSDNFGLSSKGSSVLSTSLPLNNASPISPRINRTVPVTISPCGYAKNKSKTFVIFASFRCKSTSGGRCGGHLPARHHNPLNVLAFLG
jgi:hypothetical protein